MNRPALASTRWTAATSVWWFSTKRGLSIKGRAKTKVLPLATLAAAFLPAIACVGLTPMLRRADGSGVIDLSRVDQLLDGARVVPSPAEYLTVIPAVIALFTALVVPELVSGDRADGLHDLYARSVLGRRLTWLPRSLAVATLLVLVVTGPLLVLLAGTALVGGSATPPATAALALRSAGAGLVVAITYGAAAIAVAAWSSRRDVAAAAVAGILVVPGLAVRAVLRIGGPAWVRYVDPGGAPLEYAQRVLDGAGQHPELSTVGLAAACAGLVILAVAVVAVRER